MLESELGSEVPPGPEPLGGVSLALVSPDELEPGGVTPAPLVSSDESVDCPGVTGVGAPGVGAPGVGAPGVTVPDGLPGGVSPLPVGSVLVPFGAVPLGSAALQPLNPRAIQPPKPTVLSLVHARPHSDPDVVRSRGCELLLRRVLDHRGLGWDMGGLDNGDWFHSRAVREDPSMIDALVVHVDHLQSSHCPRWGTLVEYSGAPRTKHDATRRRTEALRAHGSTLVSHGASAKGSPAGLPFRCRWRAPGRAILRVQLGHPVTGD